jgi:hypothetical protein
MADFNRLGAKRAPCPGGFSRAAVHPLNRIPCPKFLRKRMAPRMNCPRSLTYLVPVVAALLLESDAAQAAKISGTISSTMQIAEDSQLVGDVTCTVTAAACLTFTASNVTLDLNGYTVTGQADALTACNGAGTSSESGITAAGRTGVTIRGPGIVQRFRGFGISFSNATASTITGVTTATNCFAGIFLTGGALNDLVGNIAIRNGHLVSPCGGI